MIKLVNPIETKKFVPGNHNWRKFSPHSKLKKIIELLLDKS